MLDAYIYVRFNQKLDGNSYISAKIETVQHFAISGTASMTSTTSIQNVERNVLFLRHLKSRDMAWLNVIIGM